MRHREFRLLAFVLLIHAGLLAWFAARHSPCVDEVGHLPAGLSHWRLNRFDLYNVNPPLVRTVATLPLHLASTHMEFNGYQTLPRGRSEFQIGSRWMTAHPETFLRDFMIARWACIPFSLLGAVTCFLWGRELYGSRAGWWAMCLWCFCPNILAHGSLITPDAGATAVGVTACYVFRKWLTYRTMGWAIFSGIMLGLTFLTKFTWLFLLGLWPACWLVMRFCSRHSPSDEVRLAAAASDGESQFVTQRVTATSNDHWRSDLGHLLLINLLALWVLNNGYLFEDSFQRLGDFQFFSESLSGLDSATTSSEGGNRFRDSWLGRIPMPVPRNFLQGIDHIKWEYERGYPSYLRGVKRNGGWWYYYLYAMLVKMPLGTLLLIVLAAGPAFFYHRGLGGSTEVGETRTGIPSAYSATSAFRPVVPLWNPELVRLICRNSLRSVRPTVLRLFSVLAVVKSALAFITGSGQRDEQRTRRADAQPLAGVDWFETIYLLAPAAGVLWLVSSQTGFNHHLRYVLPAFPFLFIFASRTALLLESRSFAIRAIPVIFLGWMMFSSLSVYPHCLSYFNELAGGPINGWKHLDNSNIDWGQDMIYVKGWVEKHPEARPLYIHPSGYVSAEQMGIPSDAPPAAMFAARDAATNGRRQFAPGWYIMGLSRLVDPQNPWHELLQREPDGYINYSMRIYHVKQ